jgi:hypothetical protein
MQENTQAQFIHNQGFSLDWKIGYKSLFGWCCDNKLKLGPSWFWRANKKGRYSTPMQGCVWQSFDKHSHYFLKHV